MLNGAYNGQISPLPIRQGEAEVSWLFLDLNSYFASIEQQLRKDLRDKPVAVVPIMADSTCCIAASYEAKKFGIKTGTMVTEAKKLCPALKLVEARHHLYVEYHHQIVEAVESCLPVASVASIDEMACQLTGSQQKTEKAVEIAQNIKRTIRERVGEYLKCSIGIAPNRFLAKVATNLQKPDGLVVIKPSNLPQILYPLKLEDIPGIGRQMYKRLDQIGIRTMQQLCALSKLQMQKTWNGVVGERFWRWLKGEDFDGPDTVRRTVGHSHVLPPELRTEEGAYSVLHKLAHKAAMRLRKMNYWAKGVAVFVKFRRGANWSDNITMIECQDTLTILEALESMWQMREKGTPLAVGVTLFNLVPGEVHNLSLFEDYKRLRLAMAMDKVNYRYGTETLYFGGMHKGKNAAPTRIAFTSIPDLF